MPFLHIRLSGRTLDDGERRYLQDEATRLVATLLGKKAALTAVLVEEPPLAGWTVAARSVPCAASLDVRITAGTNTAQEKARFIAAAHALLSEIAGDDLHPATYVVVHEIAAESWGYGGLTQAARAGPAIPA